MRSFLKKELRKESKLRVLVLVLWWLWNVFLLFILLAFLFFHLFLLTQVFLPTLLIVSLLLSVVFWSSVSYHDRYKRLSKKQPIGFLMNIGFIEEFLTELPEQHRIEWERVIKRMKKKINKS